MNKPRVEFPRLSPDIHLIQAPVIFHFRGRRKIYMNQGLRINRQIDGRWFDHLGWETEILEAANRIEA